MPRLRDLLRSTSPALRDRFGMLCALGAVACLSSIIANWSSQYPVECSPWEQNLFGDLGDVDGPETAAPTTTENLSSSTPREVAFNHDLVSNESIPVEKKSSSLDSILALPISERPPEHRPRFIQPVNYQQPAAAPAPSAWLSGAIEIDDDETIPQEQPVPDVRNDPESTGPHPPSRGTFDRHRHSRHSMPAR